MGALICWIAQRGLDVLQQPPMCGGVHQHVYRLYETHIRRNDIDFPNPPPLPVHGASRLVFEIFGGGFCADDRMMLTVDLD